MVFIILWVVAVIVGTTYGANRGHGLAGFLLSVFLGWLGVLIAVMAFRQPRQINVNIKHELPPAAPRFEPGKSLTSDEREYFRAHTPKVQEDEMPYQEEGDA